MAHEAILSQWEPLRGWIEERRGDLLLHRRLVEAAAEWQDTGRDPEYLPREGRLAQFDCLMIYANTTRLSPEQEKAMLDFVAAGGGLVPRIVSLEGPGGPASGDGSPGPTSDRWSGVPLPEAGPWTLTVGGDAGTTGPFTASIRWTRPRGPSEDHRDVLDPAAVPLVQRHPAARAQVALDLHPIHAGPAGIPVVR